MSTTTATQFLQVGMSCPALQSGPSESVLVAVSDQGIRFARYPFVVVQNTDAA